MSKRRSGPKEVNVSDAAAPIAMTQRFLGNAAEIIADARRRGVQPDSVVLRAQSTAHSMLTVWERSPVVLRVDSEFVGALLTSETDAELTVDVLATLAFDAVAFSFETPLRLHDGTVECEYRGAIVSGASTRPTTETVTWTTYPPLSEADGFRVLWLYTQAGEVEPRVQTTTVMLTGPLGKAHTIAELIAAQLANISNLGGGYGEEMATLVPLAVLLPLCLAAAEPDLDLLAAESIGRPQQLQSSQVGNLGWRTGAALRAWREQPPAPPSGDADATTLSRMACRLRVGGGCRRTSAGRTGSGSESQCVTRLARSSATVSASRASTGPISSGSTRRRRSLQRTASPRPSESSPDVTALLARCTRAVGVARAWRAVVRLGRGTCSARLQVRAGWFQT